MREPTIAYNLDVARMLTVRDLLTITQIQLALI